MKKLKTLQDGNRTRACAWTQTHTHIIREIIGTHFHLIYIFTVARQRPHYCSIFNVESQNTTNTVIWLFLCFYWTRHILVYKACVYNSLVWTLYNCVCWHLSSFVSGGNNNCLIKIDGFKNKTPHNALFRHPPQRNAKNGRCSERLDVRVWILSIILTYTKPKTTIFILSSWTTCLPAVRICTQTDLVLHKHVFSVCVSDTKRQCWPIINR